VEKVGFRRAQHRSVQRCDTHRGRPGCSESPARTRRFPYSGWV